MKAGIITFYNHINYGAILQSYALQTKLNNLGIDAFHICFSKKDNNDDTEKPFVSNIPLLKKIHDEDEIRKKHFNDFRTKYIKEKYFANELIEDTDLFIVGSDQVWNPKITNAKPVYFANFAPNEKKVSYGASFGEDLPEQYKEIYSKEIKSFNKISVREESAKKTVKELTGLDVQVVLDPVFLLKKNEWKTLLKNKYDEKKYLLLIILQNDIDIYKKYKLKAQELGLEFKVIALSRFFNIGFESWSRISVQDYLNLIYNAQYVVTNSFHGLAFSIIFEKSFEIIELKGEMEKRKIRLLDLIQKLRLKKQDNGINANIYLKKEMEISERFIKEILK